MYCKTIIIIIIIIICKIFNHKLTYYSKSSAFPEIYFAPAIIFLAQSEAEQFQKSQRKTMIWS